MPKVFYNHKTCQNEWTYTKEEKEQMLKELNNKPKKVLDPVEDKNKDKNFCGIRKEKKHIPFNPHRNDEEEIFDWGDRYEN